MERKIIGFKLDAAGDWTAMLDCGHPQHTRHRPPFENRAWVMTQDGRDSMLGQVLNCVRCEEFELPADFVKCKVTPEFTESTMPAGLRGQHYTSSGVWGKIVVLEGRLLYCVPSKNIALELDSSSPGIVVPELPHHVEPQGSVRFMVEFYKAALPG
ncbi:MAG: DUF3565 domain-containing protein [Deltaproteobacteria bacterium]|nr:DUF3565 domain-containing protein [Deltaproteobacteria bacterium]